ncbi:MAG: hypothetical protein KC420_00325, partial [Myxococcales bacterium]|nr:hypothetical protein [Myxococcales bacterium]
MLGQHLPGEPRARRRRPTCALIMGLACALACGGGQPETSPTPATKATPEAPAEAPAPACKDFSALDPATLPPLPETPYTATFETVWRIVLEKHFDPTLACQDWPALRLEYGKRLVDAADAGAAYGLMNELLGKLGQSHFRVVPPDDVLVDDAPQGPARAPLHARWIGDEVVVVAASVDGVESGVPAGAVLLEIDGRPITEIVEHARAKARRPSELAFEIAWAIERRLSGEAGEHRSVRVRAPDGRERTIEVACVTPPGEMVSLGNLRNIPTIVESRMIDGTKIGYLAFNYWMLPMIKRVEAAMGELRAAGMEALIIDLRGNPGGVGAMSVPLARMLLSREGSLGVLRFRDFEQEFKVAANPDAFGGPLAILIDEGTASTSEIFVAGMRDLGRVKAIVGGRASAGAALPSLIERLADGATLQYVVGDYHSSKGAVAEGDGVVPDTLVQETRED